MRVPAGKQYLEGAVEHVLDEAGVLVDLASHPGQPDPWPFFWLDQLELEGPHRAFASS